VPVYKDKGLDDERIFTATTTAADGSDDCDGGSGDTAVIP